jgi:hypothetical protein
MKNKLINTTEARKILGVSKTKIANLLAEGVIPFQLDPLDKRVKLVSEKDVESLRRVRELRSGQIQFQEEF